VSQTLDGMSVTELEALKARVEATLKEQRKKEDKKKWWLGMPKGEIKLVDGVWCGWGVSLSGEDVLFALRDSEVLYSYKYGVDGKEPSVGFRSQFFEVEDKITSSTCTRVVAQLALKALGQ
jgi:hypothetical protein